MVKIAGHFSLLVMQLAFPSGMVGNGSSSQSVFCFESLIVLNLSVSSLSSAPRLSRSSSWLHLTELLSLLPSNTSAELWHSQQPDTWTAACFRERSVCVITSLLVTASRWVDTRVEFLPKGGDHWLPISFTKNSPPTKNPQSGGNQRL